MTPREDRSQKERRIDDRGEDKVRVVSLLLINESGICENIPRLMVKLNCGIKQSV